MSTKNKKSADLNEEVINNEENNDVTLSAKELYDKKKEEKLKAKAKEAKKNKSNKKAKKKKKHNNIGVKILVGFMVLLMLSSGIIGVISYFVK